MSTKITFFPVGNGDMTLIELDDASQTKILIDMNIRESADDEANADYFDVSSELRNRLNNDSNGRPYVDVFLQTHPDQDHLRGLSKHFHLGAIDCYKEPKDGEQAKIIIQEIWSSPIVWRRADRRTGHTLCEDAKAFNTEAKRRVNLYKETQKIGEAGDRIRVIGKDEDNKTDGLEAILTEVDKTFTKINERETQMVEVFVLGPLQSKDIEEEDRLSKNHSSVILQFKIASRPYGAKTNRFLCGGDAEVAIWRKLWQKHRYDTHCLRYDILLSPHHCSWHSLSEDSWSRSKNPKVDQEAKSALSQAERYATVIASSNVIKDDDNDPPCWGAKKQYEAIAKNVDGEFVCTGTQDQEVIEITLTSGGPQKSPKLASNITFGAGLASGAKPKRHG
ncbi:ComEC/Rec2 family competence protein [Methylovulum miyakonense]|uniref:hypothetical protein n=1 Tax=Methylovulum miyakonense TaxID=645578 RepID=UPI0003735CC9|nr:hypothetical protein [Methylovulum miyakonense]